MNPNQEFPILGHGDVQKKILEYIPKPRPNEDHLGPFNKYNDENHQIYLVKKRQFLEATRKYQKMTQETYTCFKTRLHNDYMSNLNLDFLNDDTDIASTVDSNEQIVNGKLLRKRTERPIHEVPVEDQTLCNLDTWFRKYLIINKLIWAARTVVLKNRLLKNLEKLKKLNTETVKEFEQIPKFYFGSYKEIFAKFI
ncbi:unnamed protein product [Psylliodes chrysocephalus]|uniref:Uncharacterized protein n=1 Tax=Psylliodes chrysocephalus TaxID=3402493 RepID=A0A9P0D0C3_9CUCU|nr:unnamed protein product [Psylliodes chrysocephala]